MKNLSRSSQHGTMPEVQNDTEGTAGSPRRAHLERPWQALGTHPPFWCLPTEGFLLLPTRKIYRETCHPQATTQFQNPIQVAK